MRLVLTYGGGKSHIIENQGDWHVFLCGERREVFSYSLPNYEAATCARCRELAELPGIEELRRVKDMDYSVSAEEGVEKFLEDDERMSVVSPAKPHLGLLCFKYNPDSTTFHLQEKGKERYLCGVYPPHIFPVQKLDYREANCPRCREAAGLPDVMEKVERKEMWTVGGGR